MKQMTPKSLCQQHQYQAHHNLKVITNFSMAIIGLLKFKDSRGVDMGTDEPRQAAAQVCIDTDMMEGGSGGLPAYIIKVIAQLH